MEIFQTNQLPGRKVITHTGVEYLCFIGTDYLGMGHNEDFRRLLSEGTKVYGTHFGSSRNGSLRLRVYDEAEGAFSSYVGTSDALLVSSGMWAGQLVMKEIEAIARRRSNFAEIEYHYAPKVHPAIIGNGYRVQTGDWAGWASNVIETVNRSSDDVLHIICSDAVGSPFVQQFDCSVFDQITATQKVCLIIDESHSLGVIGQTGEGIGGHLSPAIREQTIFVSSLNKALGIPAGMIWGSSAVVETLRSSPWFAGASPSAPSYIYAFKQLLASGSYHREHIKLRANLDHFSKKLVGSGSFLSFPDYPVFCSTSSELFAYLLQNKIMASCFAYPSPTDKPVTRIAISSIHQKEDLGQLAEVCNNFLDSDS
jgi:8-amino-7-oxononanoate synthase